MTAARKNTPQIRRGAIYRDVYAKRADDRPVERVAELERGWMHEGSLVFEDERSYRNALASGIFALRIPEWIDPTPGDLFASQFHRGAEAGGYGRFREVTAERFGDGLLGFHQRITQLEQFLLERRFWSGTYPAEVATLAEQLTALARQVLCSVLATVGIPDAELAAATGGASSDEGSYHLTFNHYRPAKEGIGLSSHKDDGFVTILRTTTPGLEIGREDSWEAVPVDPACFIVNFGLSMEILTLACATPVSAIMHRVASQAADRSSFGHFTSSHALPGADKGIFRYVPEQGLIRVCGSRELIEENDHEIYLGTQIEGA